MSKKDKVQIPTPEEYFQGADTQSPNGINIPSPEEYFSSKKKEESNLGFQTLSELSGIPSPSELTKEKGLDKKPNDATELLLKKNIPDKPVFDRIEFDENALGYDPVFIRDPEILDKVEQRANEVIEQKKKQTTWGTFGDFIENYKVRPEDLGYSGDVNLDRDISAWEAEKMAEVIQTKQRIHFEQNPEVYKGAFGQDLRQESYGLGLIKAVNTDLSMPLLKLTDDIYNTLGYVTQSPRVAVNLLRGKGDTEFKTIKTPLVRDSYDYLKSQSEQWQQLPDDEIAAHVLHGTLHLTELMVELAATPQIKIAQAARTTRGLRFLSEVGAVNAKGQVVLPKLFTQMGGRNFFTKFSESIDTEDYPLLEGLKGAGLGAKDAAIFLMLGYGSGKAAQGIKSLGANAATAGMVRATAGGTGFGGYSAVDQLIQNGAVNLRDKNQKVDWSAIDEKLLVSDFILGFGLDMSHVIGRQKNVPMTLLERASLRYFTATDATIEKARATKASISELRNKAYELREGAKQHQDPTQIQALRETAAMLDGMADIKAMDAVVFKNPQKFKDIVKVDEKIDAQQKESLVNRIDELVASRKLQDNIVREAERVQEKKSDKEGVIDITIEQQTALENIRDVTRKLEPILEDTTPDKLIQDIRDSGMSLQHVERATGRNVKDIKNKQELDSFKEVVKSQQEKVKQEFERREKLPDLKEGEIRIGSRSFKSIDEFKRFVKEHRDPSEIVLETYDPRLAKVITKELEARESDRIATLKKTPSEKPIEARRETISKEKRETIPEAKESLRKPKTEPKPKPKQEAVTPPKKPSRSIESIASSAEGDFALSLDPKVERLKSQVRDAKNEPKKIRSLIDGFLKENKKAIDEANLNKADLKALNDANTWQKAGRAIQKLTEKIGMDTPKAKAERLKGMISRNKGVLEGVPKRVQDAAMKKLSEATLTDAKYRRAVEYLDEVMSRKDYAEYENQRLGAIDKIQKDTSPKKILQKGAQGGKKPVAKRWAKLRVSDLSKKERLDQVNLLIKGEWKLDGKTHDQIIELNEGRIRELSWKEELTMSEIKEMEMLKEQNELLDFGNIHKMDLDGVRMMQERLDTYKQELAGEVTKQRNQYLEYLNSNIEEVYKVTSKKKIPASKEGEPKRKTSALANPGDASFYSMLNMLSKYDMRIYEDAPVFRDQLNHMYQDPLMLSETNHEVLQKGVDASNLKMMQEVFKTKNSGRLQREMYRLNKIKDETGVYIYNEKGERVDQLALSQMTALEKWLQWKDPDGRRAMERFDKEHQMGFTEESIRQIENFLTPETMKIADHMIRTKNELAKQYDQVYRKINGASFLNQNEFHWTLTRADVDSKVTDMGEWSASSGLRQDRTIRRTKNTIPLKYSNAWTTYTQYVKEATRYISKAELHRDLSRIFKNTEVKKNIRYNFGTRVYDDLMWHLDLMAGRNVNYRNDWMDRRMNAAARGLILARFGAAMKQGISGMYYGLDPRAKSFTHLPRTLKAVSNVSKLDKASKAYLMQQAFALYRNNTQTAMGMEMESAGTLSRTGEGAKKVDYIKTYIPTEKIVEWSGVPLRFMDRLPIINTGSVYLQDMYKHYSGKKLTEDVLKRAIDGRPDPYLRMATRDWEVMSMLTQQTTRETNSSRIRSGTQWGRVLSFAKSGPGQIARINSASLRDINKARQTGNKSQMWQSMKRLAFGHVVSGIMFEMVNQGFVIDSRDDLKELAIAAAIGPASGVPLWGQGLDLIQAYATDKWWAQEGIQVSPVVENVSHIIQLSEDIMGEVGAPVSDKTIVQNNAVKLAYELAVYKGIPAKGIIDIYDNSKAALTEREDPLRAFLGFEERDEYLKSLPILQRIKIDKVDNKKAIEHLDAYMKIDPETGNLIIDEQHIKSAIRVWGHLGIDLDYVIQRAARNEDYKWMYNNEKLKDADTKEKIMEVKRKHTLNQAELEVLNRRLEELEDKDPYTRIVDGLEALDKLKFEEGVEVR